MPVCWCCGIYLLGNGGCIHNMEAFQLGLLCFFRFWSNLSRGKTQHKARWRKCLIMLLFSNVRRMCTLRYFFLLFPQSALFITESKWRITNYSGWIINARHIPIMYNTSISWGSGAATIHGINAPLNYKSVPMQEAPTQGAGRQLGFCLVH